MNELMIFNNPEFGRIRTVEIDGEPWFVGKDVAEMLGYTNPRKALADHVDDEDKNTVTIRDGIPGNPNITIINESGVHSLILSSKLPTAKRIKRWVTSEVLPSIRKHNGYIAGQTNMAPEELMAKALLVAQKTLADRDAQILSLSKENQDMQPKALFADAVSTAKTSILIGELAKLLKQNGVEMGQNRLFGWMRDNGYLIKRKGIDYNMPTQRAMELGLFEIKETAITHSDGHVTINKTPKVTGKGQQYFVNQFLAGPSLESVTA